MCCCSPKASRENWDPMLKGIKNAKGEHENILFPELRQKANPAGLEIPAKFYREEEGEWVSVVDLDLSDGPELDR